MGAFNPNYPKLPEEVLKRYVRAIYARDYATAYHSMSQQDRQLKTEAEYARETRVFVGAALEIARALASFIRFEQIDTEVRGNVSVITATLHLPNANDPQIHALTLGFDEDRLTALSLQERQTMIHQLGELARSERLPTLTTESETWELRQEEGVWGVVMNWDKAIQVRFEAVTRAELPWAFTPVQPLMRILPGETLQTFYRVKNLSSRPITGKARHVLEPPEDAGYTEIVSCFCFFQQTLEPGEEQQLPVLFRVSPDIPEAIHQVSVRYEFYPIEHFPEVKQP
jgi:cytochrome c oxidase assembly protein Cox11